MRIRRRNRSRKRGPTRDGKSGAGGCQAGADPMPILDAAPRVADRRQPMKRYRAIAEYYDAENERLAWLKQDVPFFLRQLPRAARRTCSSWPSARRGRRSRSPRRATAWWASITRRTCSPSPAASATRWGLTERELSLAQRRRAEARPEAEIRLGRRSSSTRSSASRRSSSRIASSRSSAGTSSRRGRFWLDIFQPGPRDCWRTTARTTSTPACSTCRGWTARSSVSVDVRRDSSRQCRR